MAVEVHQPPDHVDTCLDPVLFLAGPIQGAPDWQSEAIETVQSLWTPPTTLHIFNPRWDIDPETFDKNEQISWEKKYLRDASIIGGLVFFLAAESERAPVPNKPGRAYAQTTRKEFGRAIGWKDFAPDVVITLGMEDGYKGSEDYYRHSANEFAMPIHATVKETCEEAVKTITSVYRWLF